MAKDFTVVATGQNVNGLPGKNQNEKREVDIPYFN